MRADESATQQPSGRSRDSPNVDLLLRCCEVVESRRRARQRDIYDCGVFGTIAV